jgi:hypothetical protein
MDDDYEQRPGQLASDDALTVSETTLKWSAREMFGAIVQAAADQIVKSVHRDLVSEVARSVKEQVSAQVGAKVAEVLDHSIQPTNEWGEPKGPTTSLRDVVATQARDYLGAKVDKEGRDGGYQANQTRLQYIVSKVVASEFDYRMQAEVKKAVELARNEAVAKVGQVVGDLIVKLK